MSIKSLVSIVLASSLCCVATGFLAWQFIAASTVASVIGFLGGDGSGVPHSRMIWAALPAFTSLLGNLWMMRRKERPTRWIAGLCAAGSVITLAILLYVYLDINSA